MALSIEQALYRELVATAWVVALVGTRVYPVQAPQQAVAPYVVYELAAGNPHQGLDGSTGLAWARIDYGCYAATYAAAREVAAAVMAAINHRRGVIQGVSVGSVLSQEAFDAGFDEVTQTYLHVVSFRVQYAE